MDDVSSDSVYVESWCLLCGHVTVYEPPLTEDQLTHVIEVGGGKCPVCEAH